MGIFFEKFVEARASEIHGKGLFTNIDIPAGAKIMIIAGEVISGDECERREEQGNVYIFWNGDNYIDVANTDKIKYINHNCESNCEVEDRDEFTLTLTAGKNITAGEELTIDYGYEEIYETCNCSACA
ncbi:MAG: SET domain-containing protein [Ignavibacteriaceae bacterium]